MVINNRGSMVTVSGKDPDEMARLVEGVAYLNTRHALTHTIYNSSKFIFRSEGVRVCGRSPSPLRMNFECLCPKRIREHLGTEDLTEYFSMKSNCLPKTANRFILSSLRVNH